MISALKGIQVDYVNLVICIKLDQIHLILNHNNINAPHAKGNSIIYIIN